MRNGNRRLRQFALAFAAMAGGFAAISNPAAADDRERITVLEENDGLFFNSDKHYTQGFRISDMHPVAPDGIWNGGFNLLGSVLPIFTPGGTRQESLFLGQSIFTPKNTQLRPPDPRDRPYAGWLYFGSSLLQETNGRM